MAKIPLPTCSKEQETFQAALDEINSQKREIIANMQELFQDNDEKQIALSYKYQEIKQSEQTLFSILDQIQQQKLELQRQVAKNQTVQGQMQSFVADHKLAYAKLQQEEKEQDDQIQLLKQQIQQAKENGAAEREHFEQMFAQEQKQQQALLSEKQQAMSQKVKSYVQTLDQARDEIDTNSKKICELTLQVKSKLEDYQKRDAQAKNYTQMLKQLETFHKSRFDEAEEIAKQTKKQIMANPALLFQQDCKCESLQFKKEELDKEIGARRDQSWFLDQKITLHKGEMRNLEQQLRNHQEIAVQEEIKAEDELKIAELKQSNLQIRNQLFDLKTKKLNLIKEIQLIKNSKINISDIFEDETKKSLMIKSQLMVKQKDFRNVMSQSSAVRGRK